MAQTLRGLKGGPAQDALSGYNTIWNVPPDVLEAAQRERIGSSPFRSFIDAVNNATAQYNSMMNEAFGVAQGSSGDSLFNDYFNAVMSSVIVPHINVSTPSETQIRRDAEAYLRPAADGAIEDVLEQADANKAELEADANARGMGNSTFIASMKDRQSKQAGRSVERIEAQYLSTLAKTISDNMQFYAKLKADADMANAQLFASVQSQAMGIAAAWYSDYMQAQYEQAQAFYSSTLAGINGMMSGAWGTGAAASGGASSSGGGSGGSSGGAAARSSMTAAEGKRLLGYLDDDELALLFNSSAGRWKDMHDDLALAVGDEYMATYRARARDTLGKKPGRGRGGMDYGTAGNEKR